jgi:drug/metabolite transporter (DMT)-like permease
MSKPSKLRGVITMLFAVSLLSLMDAGLKQLSRYYPPLQVGALRGLASWPLAVIWVASTTGLRPLLNVRWSLQLFRGALGISMMAAFIYALRYLPLTTVYTLFFVAPLMITALSVPILGERVGPGRWAAIAVGFTGVLVALRPSGDGMLTWSGLAVLLAATGYAISAISVRVLARTDSTQSMVFWLLTFMGLGSAALAAPDWVAIQPEHWWLIAVVGVVGMLGQYAITEAFARAEASVIAPLEYTALAWGVGFDLLLWGVLPDYLTWVGAAIIVASGLYLIRHERDDKTRSPLPESGQDLSRP